MFTIITDTREQNPLFEPEECFRETLKTGDYSMVGFTDKFAIERKSGPDLFGTLGKGHKRFKKELERGLKLDYFAIIVECSYSSIAEKLFEGSSYIKKMKPDTVLKILFTIHIKYKVPIFFSNGRYESRKIILSLMEAYTSIVKNR